MIIGIGTDICKIERIEKLIENEHFVNKIFTKNEIIYCKNKAKPAIHFAGRFAAKEAFSKAISCRYRLKFTDVEILPNSEEVPTIEILNIEKLKEITKANFFHLSISHEKEFAIAYVIAELRNIGQ
jgi:holo-[acyl-carrier protein] synthase